jgi:hypothetical protein
MSQPETTKIAETLSDITLAETRAKKLLKGGALDVKKELVENVYPLLKKLAGVAADKETVEQLEIDVDELLEQEGSTIQPELGHLLVSFVSLSMGLVEGVRGLKLDDVTKKKLEVVCREIEAQAPVVIGEVQAATIEVEDGGGDPDGAAGTEDDEDEDDDDGEADEEAPAEVEALPVTAETKPEIA